MDRVQRIIEMWHHINMVINLASRYSMEFDDLINKDQAYRLRDMIVELINMRDDVEKMARDNNIDLRRK